MSDQSDFIEEKLSLVRNQNIFQVSLAERDLELLSYPYTILQQQIVLKINIDNLIKDCTQGDLSPIPSDLFKPPQNEHDSQILDLPQEILLLIFEYLPPIKLIMLRLTCLPFNNITRDKELWRIVCHNYEKLFIWEKLYFDRNNTSVNNLPVYGSRADLVSEIIEMSYNNQNLLNETDETDGTDEMNKKNKKKNRKKNKNKNKGKTKTKKKKKNQSQTNQLLNPNEQDLELNRTNNNLLNSNNITPISHFRIRSLSTNNSSVEKTNNVELSISRIRHYYIDEILEPEYTLINKLKKIKTISKELFSQRKRNSRLVRQHLDEQRLEEKLKRTLPPILFLFPLAFVIFTILLNLYFTYSFGDWKPHIYLILSPFIITIVFVYLVIIANSLLFGTRRSIKLILASHLGFVIPMFPVLFIVLKVCGKLPLGWVSALSPPFAYLTFGFIIALYSCCDFLRHRCNAHYTFLNISMLVWYLLFPCFLLLLGLRLDERIDWGWSYVFIPLFIFELFPMLFLLSHPLLTQITRVERMDIATTMKYFLIGTIPFALFQLLLILWLREDINFSFTIVMIPIYLLDIVFTIVGVSGIHSYLFGKNSLRAKNCYDDI
ncbi:fam11a [Anaeramoeba flamelloides]|uniref:Fam11a n=1 Tax=Anaeramoeba flamelloides TaxID=1746091 RepID=A0ABQ8Y6X1_9EUKA|nr:fam11a [Anaeramoeba flamelloides]